MNVDEQLLKQLVRQMKILNFWVTFFGVLFVAALAIAGFMLYKMVTFVHQTEQKIDSIQAKTSQTLNVQNQLCSDATLKTLLSRTSSDYCP
jgi:cell division protein FtsL